MKENFEVFMNNFNRFFDTCGSIGKFIDNCFSEPRFLIEVVQGITQEILLPLLLGLVILRFLGFKGVTKYIALSLVIAVWVALI